MLKVSIGYARYSGMGVEVHGSAYNHTVSDYHWYQNLDRVCFKFTRLNKRRSLTA
jgi:hypothetical protein